ncbi:MAG TPA: diguanylate cyclase [Syntrophomonadaceae bacterium]|nr:diguanylate cyclase [Syntrophomonadaceae bacterium]
MKRQDPLTGFYNRDFFLTEVLHLDTQEHLPLSIIIINVNGFAFITDALGTRESNRLLQLTASIMKQSCREGDIFSRWGEEEFIILLPGTLLEEAEIICQRIRMASGPVKTDMVQLSLSMGVAVKRHAQEDIEDVYKKARQCMDEQKVVESKKIQEHLLYSLRTGREEKNKDVREHGRRSRMLTREIGKTIGLPEYKLSQLELLAQMHDVGKTMIDDSILNKPGPLTDEEWEHIKRHPQIGCRIAELNPATAVIAPCILSHHERWDGKGYPNGLKGKRIPFFARILAVVDAYDAMTQNRPYRKAMLPTKAIKELLNNAGSQFDPEVVQIFVEKVLIDKKEAEQKS